MPAPWKLLSGSTTGTSHLRSGETCQDYAHGRIVECEDALVLACADGAGSASNAAIGAKLACLAFVSIAAASLDNGLRTCDITAQRIFHWNEQTRRRLALEACVRGLELRDFACTLLTAIVGIDSAVFSQIGDGAIIVLDGDDYQAVFRPQRGEYANTTFFLTGEAFDEHLVVRVLDRPVDELAMLTDGLQHLALHYASGSIHAPFFDPMFRGLRRASRAEDLEGPLRDWLDSTIVNERTDDDKTLILATRRTIEP